MIAFIRGIRIRVSTVLDADLGEDLVHERRELPIPLADQTADPAAGVLQIHHQVLDDLYDPARGRVRGGAEYADASAYVLDDGQDVLLEATAYTVDKITKDDPRRPRTSRSTPWAPDPHQRDSTPEMIRVLEASHEHGRVNSR
ncbi:hypothetical protein GCM10009555_034200 [Acrocarpospora macrocephala]|uniref:Uncharacterized protein n=1 Tax=Acrocarpospora macrocephala TaxID=150177 RepID=A0A5M3WHK2_9ACTN|nr:hypothetical protein [Acrocarpospora macrocephala]GES06601.1 hypothetical protein Amac_001960 [Acrocarpospora macrocephala]